ncbi:MAG: DNA polymerase III subunit delta [Planctomycetota bacterium]
MAEAQALHLDKQLGNEPASVYALVGEDDALQTRALELLERFAAPEDQPGSTVRRFEETPEPADVFGELRTVPFMGMEGRRLVVLEAADEFVNKHSDPLTKYLERPSRTGTLVLCLKSLDGRTRAAKAIDSAGMVVDCSKLRWKDARGWLRSAARERGKSLTREAVYNLVEAVGPNLLALENELEKLALYVGERETITEEDVGEMAAEARSRSVFDLGQAVAAGDTAEALRLCEELLLRGERVVMIIGVLARQVRRYWQMKRLLRDDASQNEIARATGMPGFAVRNVRKDVENRPEAWFPRRLRMLSEADYESKTKSPRAREEQLWLETLLARLCGGE